LSPRGGIRVQDLQGRQPGRPPLRTAYEVRAGDQPQDSEGAGTHDSAYAAGAGGSGHPVIDRRAFIGRIAGVLAAPLAEAREGKVWRIGYLTGLTDENPTRVAFRQRLRELGYAEGINVAIEIRSAGGRLERFPALAAELVRLKVDVIVAGGD